MSTSALERLRSRLAAEPGLVVAFSGGADSALLAWAAHQVLGERALAVTAVSASLPAAERSAARAFARAIAAVSAATGPSDVPAVTSASRNAPACACRQLSSLPSGSYAEPASLRATARAGAGSIRDTRTGPRECSSSARAMATISAVVLPGP